MSNTHFDVIVIGAGPAGYIAAIRAAQLGKTVACIDASSNAKGEPALGGTCTNVGCIPSKALLQSSEHFEHAKLHFAEHGITTSGIKLDVATMLGRKDKIVEQTNSGIAYLFKKNKVQFFHGTAAFAAASEGSYSIDIAQKNKTTTLTGTHIIIATGSQARPLPDVPFDETTILSNDGTLRLPAVPKKLGIIGAGVIGLELGSVWRRLGAEVTILEALPNFLGAADSQVAQTAQRSLEQQGLDIKLGVTVDNIQKSKTKKPTVHIAYTDSEQNQHTLTVDKLIVSIGRIPNTAGLNAQAVGLQLGERGDVVVDANCQTNLPNVWAVGDVVRGPMLAHKAEEEAVAVAERIAGQHGHVDFDTIPWVIYTQPEIAWVGKTEQQLKDAKIDYRIGNIPFMANGRARALGDTTGFVKMLADAQTDTILGVHIVGAMASELIAECVVAMNFHASSEDIARICHAHPSLAETTKEAALAVDKRALNF